MESPIAPPVGVPNLEIALDTEATASPHSALNSSMTHDNNPASQPLRLLEANKPSIPSKELLKSLYEDAVGDDDSYQSHLLANSDLGKLAVLSVPDVWLPGAVAQVQESLRAVQAKVQRDKPDQVMLVKRARMYVEKQLGESCKKLKENRTKREEEYRRVLREEKEQEKEQLARERKIEVFRLQNDKRKHHPYNVELWKEVGVLTAGSKQLGKEQELWDEAVKQLPEKFEKARNRTEDEDDDVSAMQLEDEENPLTEELAETKAMMQNLLNKIGSVRGSIDQFHPAIAYVKEIRNQLYQKHRQMRFKNYPGVQQPRDLLRILSQDTEADALL